MVILTITVLDCTVSILGQRTTYMMRHAVVRRGFHDRHDRQRPLQVVFEPEGAAEHGESLDVVRLAVVVDSKDKVNVRSYSNLCYMPTKQANIFHQKAVVFFPISRHL